MARKYNHKIVISIDELLHVKKKKKKKVYVCIKLRQDKAGAQSVRQRDDVFLGQSSQKHLGKTFTLHSKRS